MIKNHLFNVEAYFKESIVLAYAAPKERLAQMIPKCLEIDDYQNEWGFIAVAMVQTTGLRPTGFPKFMGNDFFLVGYRIFVRYQTSDGKNLRGLYILKSQTDKKQMELLGNLFTHYNYETVDLKRANFDGKTEISSSKAGISCRYNRSIVNASLPETSPFANWKEARRFAGPLPHTFTYLPEKSSVLIVEGARQNWDPTPLAVTSHHFDYLYHMGIKDMRLANAFIVNSIPYEWKKGRLDRWEA